MSKLLGPQEQTRGDNYFASGITRWVSTVADRLREAMEDRGVDQSALARAIGVTQGAISLILLGKTRQSKYLPEIAIELGVSYDWLSGRDVDKFADSPIDMLITSTERDLIERMRALPPPASFAFKTVANGFMFAHLLPSEAALADMFEAQLRVYGDLRGAELARALARRLPSGLARLREAPLIEPSADQHAQPEADELPVEDRPVRRRAQRK